MLSTASRPYIEASVPVLREHGLAITRRFYDDMFSAHPELRSLFNMGNQANGSQQQSLAAAVFAYAANIDNSAALQPVIERIVHKHASVGIRPAHYPIVGRHLLGSIQAVLGEAATPALLGAWDEAYWLLAGELIAAEARLYRQAGAQAGDLMPVHVIDVRRESDNVISYTLQTEQGGSPGPFQPGQYCSVAVQVGDLRQLRQYSLSDAPSKPWWRISVKREDGVGSLSNAIAAETALSDSKISAANAPAGMVSSWLHTHVKQGNVLQVSPAFGDFTPRLQGERPIALVSAGIGITPMMSVLNALLEARSTRPVLFMHAARHSRQHALREDLKIARERLATLRTIVAYESPLAGDRLGDDYQRSGRLDLSRELTRRDVDADFYLCGPIGFMREQWQALLQLGVDPERIHREVFGPELLDHLL